MYVFSYLKIVSDRFCSSTAIELLITKDKTNNAAYVGATVKWLSDVTYQ